MHPRTHQSARLALCASVAFASLYSGASLARAQATRPAHSSRTTISLDGTWDIADSVSGDDVPTSFSHKVPVPGLAHSAQPAFADVDLFDSREIIANRVRRKELPESANVTTAGVSRQQRDYFWYRTTFDPHSKQANAILKINKAQFGIAVWLNGQKIGEHFPCFTAAFFDLGANMHWSAPNELLIRVGAHPGVLPPSVSAGSDFEKNRWTPGLYDDVSVLLSGDPVISSVQVAPHLNPSEIEVQTKLHNYSNHEVKFALRESVHEWKESGSKSAGSGSENISLAAGEEKTVTHRVSVPNAKLWTPETPNLYVLESDTGGDSAATRFGMREFRFDTPTRRAYLNGKPYFLRGSNITLHRFFEDPDSGTLPWDDAWVRRVLIDIPKKMHWNSFRFCIGPVPDKWLDIADEAGLLIQNEYFVWTGDQHAFEMNYSKTFDLTELTGEYRDWMRDNWNHPSVAIWDASNESWQPDFSTKLIPAVRGLDLSNRPWENSYNPPAGPDDPVEDHPYEFVGMHFKSRDIPDFKMVDLESRGGGERSGISVPTGHASILNEYGWLWLNRDGSPTLLTNDVYPVLLGPNSTADERREEDAYLLAGLTEFWRAYRKYAAVLHFVYLTAGDPRGFTCDHFRDVKTLELDPYFVDYMGNAFKPLGVYVNFWHDQLPAKSHQVFQVMLANDMYETESGDLDLVLENDKGTVIAHKTSPFSVAPLGQETQYIDFNIPDATGKCMLKAIAKPSHGPQKESTVSRRRVELVAGK
jgi:beta-galactosidase